MTGVIRYVVVGSVVTDFAWYVVVGSVVTGGVWYVVSVNYILFERKSNTNTR